MPTRPELILLAAILLGIAGGGVAFYFWQSVLLSIGAAVGSLFSAVLLLRAVTA